MKTFSSSQINDIEKRCIEIQELSSIELIENASRRCFEWIIKFINNKDTFLQRPRIIIFCGTGNNGADGLALARMLFNVFIDVEVYTVSTSSKRTIENEHNLKRLIVETSILPIVVDNLTNLKDIHFNSNSFIIDAILGSGINRQLAGNILKCVEIINNSNLPVCSIDLPTGFGLSEKPIKYEPVNATHTLTFHCFKTEFSFPSIGQSIGLCHIIDIGIDEKILNANFSNIFYVRLGHIKRIIKTRDIFTHKGNYGHVLLITGQYGKMGASIILTDSCSKSGTGLITTHVPKAGVELIQALVPEAIVSHDKHSIVISELPDLKLYTAIAVGPSIGTNIITQKALLTLLQNSKVPLVIDADALNIISLNKEWLALIPAGSILTPHPKEFERLFGKSESDKLTLDCLLLNAMKYNIYIVLKGAYTKIGCPDGKIYINSTGNSGMAKGGSGDSLTGIIVGLLAQGYSSLDASIFGTYIHGLAGNIANMNQTEYSMTSRSINNFLSEAFKYVSSD